MSSVVDFKVVLDVGSRVVRTPDFFIELNKFLKKYLFYCLKLGLFIIKIF